MRTKNRSANRAYTVVGATTLLGVSAAAVLGFGGASEAADSYTVRTHGAPLIVRDDDGNRVGTVENGEKVRIICQRHGRMVADGYFSESDLWDVIAPGQAVSDAFVDTKTSGMVADPCPDTAAVPTPAPTSPAVPSGPGPGHWLSHEGPDDYRGTPYGEDLSEMSRLSPTWNDPLGRGADARTNTGLLPAIPALSVKGHGVPTGTKELIAFGGALYLGGVVADFEKVTEGCLWRVDFRFTPHDPADGPPEVDEGTSPGTCDRSMSRIMKYERVMPLGELCADLIVSHAWLGSTCVNIVNEE